MIAPPDCPPLALKNHGRGLSPSTLTCGPHVTHTHTHTLIVAAGLRGCWWGCVGCGPWRHGRWLAWWRVPSRLPLSCSATYPALTRPYPILSFSVPPACPGAACYLAARLSACLAAFISFRAGAGAAAMLGGACVGWGRACIPGLPPALPWPQHPIWRATFDALATFVAAAVRLSGRFHWLLCRGGLWSFALVCSWLPGLACFSALFLPPWWGWRATLLFLFV